MTGPIGQEFVAKRLGQAAGYIRSHCTRDMLANVTAAVRRNPAPALFGAVLAGVLIGRTFRITTPTAPSSRF